MPHRVLMPLAVAAWAALSACSPGDDDTTVDARDTADLPAEVDADVPAEADAEPEAEVDEGVDADGDGGDDAGGDAEADLSAEADADASPEADDAGMTCETIGVVRAMTDGDVAVLLCRVLVTYVFPQGWFVQEAAAGPAIEIFEGSAWTPDVAVGDEVTIPVTSLSTYHGTKTVYAHDVVTVHSSGNSIASYIEDVSAGTPLGEDNECEPVRITDGIVDAVAGLDVTVTYGTASGAALRVADASGFCAGARFDVVAPVTEWDGAYRVQSFQAADFTRIDTTACAGGGRVPVPGDLLLNEFLADPPADLPGDANCDGIRDGSSQQDEFVELVNVSADRLSLAGVTVSDTVGVRHTFSAGTSLDAGGVIVVFGGGSPSCTWPSGVQVVTAGDGQLGLNNTGDTLTVAVGAGASAVTLQRTTFGSEGGRDTSLTLSPDLTDTNVDPAIPGGFVAHTTADTADASPFSPGTRIDGSAL